MTLYRALLLLGDKFRIGMYVGTTTRKAVLRQGGDLRKWWEGEMGEEAVYSWKFTIPRGCRQATRIQDVSAHKECEAGHTTKNDFKHLKA